MNKQSVFLTANWRKLIIFNYEIDPKVLNKYLPKGTELDTFQGKHLISLVGFLFENTKVYNLSIPFHKNFEEVNLRFYVRRKVNNEWRRGVVFVKEIVPKHAISFIARTVYKEPYITLPMSHSITENENKMDVSYRFKLGTSNNELRVCAENKQRDLITGSVEEFITEHYYGYTKISDIKTSEYEVEHPPWKTYKINYTEIAIDAHSLYGKEINEAIQTRYHSTILAEGSPIVVRRGNLICGK